MNLLKITVLTALLSLSAFAATPSIFATYWDAAMIARAGTVLPLQQDYVQRIQVFVYDSTFTAEAYMIRVDYIDKAGNKTYQQQAATVQSGIAFAAFFGVNDVKFLSTTVTPLARTGETTIAPQP